MKYNTTRSELYIVELEPPFKRLMIQFVPETISAPRTASIQNFAIVGRNNEILNYTTGSETLNLNLEFLSTDDSRRDAWDAVNWLKACTANDGRSTKYKNVLLLFGDFFKNESWIISSVNPDFSHFSADHKWMPLRCKVGVTFVLDPDRNFSSTDISNR